MIWLPFVPWIITFCTRRNLLKYIRVPSPIYPAVFSGYHREMAISYAVQAFCH
jgi:hypothetical protein